MKKSGVLDLTIGAMFAAIYALLALLGRFVFISLDSFIYFLIPIPIAIYAYWKDFQYSFLTLMVMIAVSFIINISGSVVAVITLTIPNLVLGFGFGLLKKYAKSNLFTIIFSLMLSLLAEILAMLGISEIMGITYFDYFKADSTFIQSMFNMSDNVFSKIISITIPIVIVLDAFLKVFLLIVIFVIVVRRLKMDEDISMNIRFIFSFPLAVFSIFLSMSSLMITIIFFALDNGILWPIIMAWILTLFIDLYIIFVFLTFKSQILIAKKQKLQAFLWILLGVLFLPITYFIACYYHLFLRQILLREGGEFK